MTKPLPFTKASIKRRIAAAREAGLKVSGIRADGTLILVDESNSAPLAPVSNTEYAKQDEWGDAQA